MRAATALILIAGAGGALPARADGVELELSPGLAITKDFGIVAPALRARAGINLTVFSFSAVGQAAFTPDPGYPRHSMQQPGLQLWSIAAEGRFHTQGNKQFGVGVAGGWGRVILAQPADEDIIRLQGPAAPYVEALVGYRHLSGSLVLGIDGSVQVFNRTTVSTEYAPQYQGALLVFGVRVALGWRGLEF